MKMRRQIAAFAMVLLLTGCTTGSPGTVANGPESGTKPAEGVALTDLDLSKAPPVQVVRTAAPAGNGPAVDMTDVTFGKDGFGYSVTGSGTISRSSDGGATWVQSFHADGFRFSRVELADDKTAFAVAQTGCLPGPNCEGPVKLVTTVDAGGQWQQFEPRLPPGSPAANDWWHDLGQLFWRMRFQFLSAQDGFATLDPTENYGPAAPPILVTHDGGRSWQKVALPEGLAFAGGFSFHDVRHGYVTAASKAGEYQLLETKDGGQTWQQRYATRVYPLLAVDFPTATDGYLAGGMSPKVEAQPRQLVLATHDGGATWNVAAMGENKGSPIVQMQWTSSTTGWAAQGGCWSMGANGPCGGTLAYTADGGKTWQDSGQRVERIRAAGREAWAIQISSATTLLRTDDAGKTWQTFARPDSVRVSYVHFLSKNEGVIGTNRGFYRTEDGGQHWTFAFAGTPNLRPVFLSESTLLDTSGHLQRSSDGGQTWQPVGGPDLWGALAAAGPLDAWLSLPATKCPAAGCPPSLLHSADGGLTWQPVVDGPDPHLSVIAFADSRHGLGFERANTLLLTADGGKSWKAAAAPQDLMLSQGTFAGSSQEVWLAGNKQQETMQNPSVLLHSTDGGAHFTAALAPETTWVSQLDFLSATDGWMIVMMKSGSGLLATHDGGKTWTEVWPQL